MKIQRNVLEDILFEGKRVQTPVQEVKQPAESAAKPEKKTKKDQKPNSLEQRKSQVGETGYSDHGYYFS